MMISISVTFGLSTAWWVAMGSANIVRLSNLRSGIADTKDGMVVLNNAISAEKMTRALSLINVSAAILKMVS